MPCGVGGVPTGAGLVDGGVDQGPWLLGGVGGGVGSSKKKESWRSGGVQGLRLRGGRW